ncbi:MAG: cytidine deaminase [Alistipes sp.]|nr:cytidine deaminase [Candidatus Alistipes equi]
MKKTYNIDYLHYDSLDELSEDEKELVEEARKAVKKAYSIYSHFSVGAALRLRSGRIIHGANCESEVFPAGLCAERSALFYAEVNYADDPIETIAIASSPAERECYPCGQCRQVILDVQRRQGNKIKIIMASSSTASVISNAEDLLPFTFKL